jgi:hypothetical protein
VTPEELIAEWRSEIAEARSIARGALPDDAAFIRARARMLEACAAQLESALAADMNQRDEWANQQEAKGRG